MNENESNKFRGEDEMGKNTGDGVGLWGAVVQPCHIITVPDMQNIHVSLEHTCTLGCYGITS